MKKLELWKTNFGHYSNEYEICKSFTDFDGCGIVKTDSSVQIFRGQKAVLDIPMSYMEQDSFSITYTANNFQNNLIRICCIHPKLAAIFGDAITFASRHKDGFAVHYNIK